MKRSNFQQTLLIGGKGNMGNQFLTPYEPISSYFKLNYHLSQKEARSPDVSSPLIVIKFLMILFLKLNIIKQAYVIDVTKLQQYVIQLLQCNKQLHSTEAKLAVSLVLDSVVGWGLDGALSAASHGLSGRCRWGHLWLHVWFPNAPPSGFPLPHFL